MVIIFFLELLVLFLLSRTLTSEISYLFFSIFRSRKIAMILMAIIFLPGTIIHEFAHAIMAKILFVHVGKMEFMPQLHGESLKLGSVEVGKVDIVRNFFIGVAPFIVGTSLLLTILFYSFSKSIIGFNIHTFIICLLSFIIANTMYSSKKDMEGAIQFFLIIVAPILLLYFFGLRIPGLNWDLFNSIKLDDFFQSTIILLGVPLILDIGIIVFAKVITRR